MPNEQRFDAARNAFALKMAALHDLSFELAIADGVDDLCRKAVGMGHNVLGYDRIGIWFVDPADPALLYGSYGTDEKGRIRDERGVSYRRSDESLPEGFYEGREPVYYLGVGPCFNERHEVVGNAEKALALIWDGHKVIGEIWVDNLISQLSIDGGSLELLVRFARIVGCLTGLKRIQAELELLASTDDQTGVVNKRTVLLFLEKQLALAARKVESVAIVLCDVGGIAELTQTRGNAAVDEQIRAACSVLTSSVRDSDTVGRLSSDEFLLVLPDCDEKGAERINGRIEAALAQVNSSSIAKAGKISLTRGIAVNGQLDGSKEHGAQALLDLAVSRMPGPPRPKDQGKDARSGLLERASGGKKG